jgi:hypothetical protein
MVQNFNAMFNHSLTPISECTKEKTTKYIVDATPSQCVRPQEKMMVVGSISHPSQPTIPKK